ncbi:MAG: CarD family transcriptional regulator [Deltaproteobacteria bacterium]|nr:CarD family transcriptional regulator [Deltaproteobacteria bacterium]MBW2305719.1 CarD family transcriptional regulator [Deltaproteobacteria bacterium]
MFNIGDLAVYPAHGVGIIEAIEKKEFSGSLQTFYIMRVLDSSMTIMIPTDNVKNVGLREIIDTKDIPKIYEILQERHEIPENQTWNRRYRDYMEKIKTGSVYEIAKVLRDLTLLKNGKDLSFGERKMLDTARSLLIKELSIARNTPEEVVEKDIFRFF